MKYRVYYNRSLDWPQVWSIDEGDQTTESNVIDYLADGCLVRGRSLPPPVRSVEGGAPVFPTAWVEIEAAGVQMACGVAVFIPHCRSTL